MRNRDKARLVAAAVRAASRACASYSGFQVGAALLTTSGQIVTGANVESASYGLTCCAERVALFTALTAGRSNFVAIAVVAPISGGPMPCGACRQLLTEYAAQAQVLVADSRAPDRIRSFSIGALLPAPFTCVPGFGIENTASVVSRGSTTHQGPATNRRAAR